MLAFVTASCQDERITNPVFPHSSEHCYATKLCTPLCAAANGKKKETCCASILQAEMCDMTEKDTHREAGLQERREKKN